MKKTLRMVIICAVIAAVASYDRAEGSVLGEDLMQSLQKVRHNLGMAMDIDLVKEYIQDKSPTIRCIVDKMYRSFGQNG